MAKIPQVSDAEWEVMRVLWARSPLAAADIIEALEDRKDWSPRTIKTLLTRLVKKQALAYEEEGNRYLYRPKLLEADCVREESRSFLSRVFAGRAGEMLCRFVDEVELSKDDIAQLRKALERKRR